jgi:hypothetical protein
VFGGAHFRFIKPLTPMAKSVVIAHPKNVSIRSAGALQSGISLQIQENGFPTQGVTFGEGYGCLT